MPALPSPLPEEVKKAFRDGIDEFLAEDDPDRDALARATISGVRSYALGLDEIEKAPERYDVHAIGWRVNASDIHGRYLLSADIAVRDGMLRLVNILRDDRAKALAQQLSAAKDKVPLDENYTVTLLRIPGILTDAFVLRPEDVRAPSRMLPIQAPKDTFELMALIDIKEFFERVTSPRGKDGRSLVERFRDFNKVEVEPAGSA